MCSLKKYFMTSSCFKLTASPSGVFPVLLEIPAVHTTRKWSKIKTANIQPYLSKIDNHDNGYLEMAAQLYVQAHLGHYHVHILIQEEYSKN